MFRPMSDAYDPRQELAPGPVIMGAVIMFALAVGVVGYITKFFQEAKPAKAAAATSAPANVEAPAKAEGK